jgi:hypothetical protein
MFSGWAFDNNPIYGSFGFSNPLNFNSPIKKMRSSYRLRNITDRTKLPNGTMLSSIYFAPNVTSSYVLGTFQQDYQFVEGLGDLGDFNKIFSMPFSWVEIYSLVFSQ